MRLKGKNRKSVYHLFSELYKRKVSDNFSFKSGEKKRLRQVFTKIAEQMGIRDEERFKEVAEMYTNYVRTQMKKWLKWEKRSRSNLIGFLDRSEDIEVFVAGVQDVDTNIAGRKNEKQWDF